MNIMKQHQTCRSGKVCFTKREAQAILNSKKQESGRNKKECRYYHCDTCNLYHLTSMEHQPLKKHPAPLKFKDEWSKLLVK